MRSLTQRIAKAFLSPKPHETTAAIVLAAGGSTRMGGNVSKQFIELCGIPVLAYTLLAYQATPAISEIIVAARREDFDRIAGIRKEYGITKLHSVVTGGNSRQESAARAFAKIGPDVLYVAVADGARCLTTPAEIENVCTQAYRFRAASAAQRVVGTVKRTNAKGSVTGTVNRENLWEAQTPQVFHISLYAAALERAKRDGWDVTDDNAMVERIGQRVQLVECSKENIKITTPEDLRLATAILALRVAQAEEES